MSTDRPTLHLLGALPNLTAALAAHAGGDCECGPGCECTNCGCGCGD